MEPANFPRMAPFVMYRRDIFSLPSDRPWSVTVTASIAGYVCGRAIDLGVTARAATFAVGAAMLLPALAWAVSMRSLWDSRDQVSGQQT